MKNKKVRITHRSVSFERRWIKTKEFKNTIRTLSTASIIGAILPMTMIFFPRGFFDGQMIELLILESMSFIVFMATVAIDVRTITEEELENLEYERIS